MRCVYHISWKSWFNCALNDRWVDKGVKLWSAESDCCCEAAKQFRERKKKKKKQLKRNSKNSPLWKNEHSGSQTLFISLLVFHSFHSPVHCLICVSVWCDVITPPSFSILISFAGLDSSCSRCCIAAKIGWEEEEAGREGAKGGKEPRG